MGRAKGKLQVTDECRIPHAVESRSVSAVGVQQVSRHGSRLLRVASFASQDARNLYLVAPQAPYGGLDGLIENHPVDDLTLKYVVDQMVLAIEYLHATEILLRDLAVGNVFIFDDLHVKIAVFGSRKLLDNERAHSIFEDCIYFAPETSLRKGYGFPFLGPKDQSSFRNKMKMTLRKVMRANPQYPHRADKGQLVSKFIISLLMKNPSQRLGEEGAVAVKSHA